jgi:hypothetical protein
MWRRREIGNRNLNIFKVKQNAVVRIFLAIFAVSLCGFVVMLFQSHYDAVLQAFATILAALLAASVVGWQIHSAVELERQSHQRQTTTKIYGDLSKCVIEAQKALLALPYKRQLVENIIKLPIPDMNIKFETVENAIKDFSEQYDIQQSKISEFIDTLISWKPIIPASTSIVIDLHPLRTAITTEYPKVWQGLQEAKLKIYKSDKSGQDDLELALLEHSKSLESISERLHSRLTTARLELRELINNNTSSNPAPSSPQSA